jgi:hypothetical protein
VTTSGSRKRSYKPGWERPTRWRPEFVGVKPGYPKTPEAWEAQRERSRQHAKQLHERGGFTRRGIPDGWSGRREELADIRAENLASARQAVARMRERGELLSDDERAEFALAYAMSIVLDPAACATDRLAAARLVLTYTLARPTTRPACALVDAERLLAELLDRA